MIARAQVTERPGRPLVIDEDEWQRLANPEVCWIGPEGSPVLTSPPLLTAGEIEVLQRYPGNLPVLLQNWALRAFADAHPNGSNGHAFRTVEDYVCRIQASLGYIAKHLQMPFPFPYYHNLVLTMYSAYFLMAFAMVQFHSWLSIPALFIIVVVCTGTREVAAALADPFGEDEVDFPINRFVREMRCCVAAVANAEVEWQSSLLARRARPPTAGPRPPSRPLQSRRGSEEPSEPSPGGDGEKGASDHVPRPVACRGRAGEAQGTVAQRWRGGAKKADGVARLAVQKRQHLSLKAMQHVDPAALAQEMTALDDEMAAVDRLQNALCDGAVRARAGSVCMWQEGRAKAERVAGAMSVWQGDKAEAGGRGAARNLAADAAARNVDAEVGHGKEFEVAPAYESPRRAASHPHRGAAGRPRLVQRAVLTL